MRIGRFAISERMAVREPELARAIMGKCIIVRCEMMYETNKFEYVAISDEFGEVPEGSMTPEYEVHISAGGARIEFVRADKTDVRQA